MRNSWFSTVQQMLNEMTNFPQTSCEKMSQKVGRDKNRIDSNNVLFDRKASS